MPRTRPAYAPEFRREAVELVRTSGRSIPQIAAELGCAAYNRAHRLHQVMGEGAAVALVGVDHP